MPQRTTGKLTYRTCWLFKPAGERSDPGGAEQALWESKKGQKGQLPPLSISISYSEFLIFFYQGFLESYWIFLEKGLTREKVVLSFSYGGKL